MKVICQRCNQVLPQTAVMCPNCGNRSFTPIDDHQANQYLQQRPSTSQPVAAASANPWHTQQPPAMPTPSQSSIPSAAMGSPAQSGYPQASPTPQAYAPAAQGYPNPSQSAQGTQPAYQAPIQPTAPPPQPTYQAPPMQPHPVAPSYSGTAPNLPSSSAHGRKLASQMQYAGFFRRGFAYGFDLVLIGLLLALAYQLGLPKLADYLGVRSFNQQSLAVTGVAFYLFYMAFFTSLGRQATIGKIIMGLWVFGMQGQRINFFQALFREVVKVLLVPFFFIMWFTARKQTLADFMARTVVLYDPS